MKRVSPLKHQPETTESDSDSKVQGHGEPGEAGKDEANLDKPSQASMSANGPDGKPKALGVGMVGGTNAQVLFGELEHYDLDMDEILDVPYIKSSQQMSTLPRVPHDKRSVTGSNLVGGTLERNRGGVKNSALTHNEPLSLGSNSGSSSQTPVRALVSRCGPCFCVQLFFFFFFKRSKTVDFNKHIYYLAFFNLFIFILC